MRKHFAYQHENRCGKPAWLLDFNTKTKLARLLRWLTPYSQSNSMKNKSNNESPDSDLKALFVDQIRDILWAEKQLTKALPKMAKAANDPELQKAFSSHLEETKGHVERLGEILSLMGLSTRAKKCPAMEGLLEEADEMSEEYANSPALDAALIAAAQKVEHYEIATYGTLRAFAKRLGLKDAEALLAATLKEESAADETLTTIATGTANDQATVV